VDFVGDQFFARTRLTEDEHRSLRRSDHVNLAANLPQGRASADQVTKGLRLDDSLLQVSVLQFQLGFGARWNSGELLHDLVVGFA
jgi:hypothetical protein